MRRGCSPHLGQRFNAGGHFTGWEVDSEGTGIFADASSVTTTFTMPAGGATVEATYDDPHVLVHHEAQAPTCADAGWDAYDTCEECGYSTFKEIPATGEHDFHNGFCSVCGTKDPDYVPPYVPSAPSGPDWDDVMGDIASAKTGDRVVVDMEGETVLPGEVLNALAGRDVMLALQMDDGVAWEIWGEDVPEGEVFSDTDMGVELGTDGISVDVVDLVTGEHGSVQVTLAHNGSFGFELTLVAPLGEKNEGLYANLYSYDEAMGSLSFESSAVVGEGGVARLVLDHASQWLVALDSRSHELPFPDAVEGQWYSEPVRWAWLSGVMTGYGDGETFGALNTITRAEMAQVLWNQAGKPEAEADLSGFADVDASGWYADAVAWCLSEGIFQGYGDAFGTERPISREEVATVLWRLSGEPESSLDLSSFSDAASVSDYATGALAWAVGSGVVAGKDDGTKLDPQGVCTRAEAAAMLMRMGE